MGALISLREDAKAALPALADMMDSDDSDLATLGTEQMPCRV